MLSVREERGPAVGRFEIARIELCHRNGSSSTDGDAKQRIGRRRREYDDTVVSPRTAPTVRRLADDLCRASGDVDSLQLPVCEERDGPVVG